MRLKALLPRLMANWITLLGSVIAATAGFAILVLLIIGLFTSRANPYLSVFVVVLLPLMFALGLLLIPIGVYVDRRRGRGPGDALQLAFETVLKDRTARRRLLFFASATIVNVALISIAGQKTISYINSAKFCGTTCHPALQPEWDAWNRSPHSNVACVECHIGPGALSKAKAKWNGLHELFSFLTSRYDRPIVAGHNELLPAKETCEQCHAPKRFWPDRIKMFPHYNLDKANTPKFNAMLLHIGGLNPRTQKYEGIHWHANPDNQVKFEFLDEERTKVGKITVLAKGQMVAEYLPPGTPQKAIGVRTMDCIDCHNRPTHIFVETPKRAIDRALYFGALDAKMPFIAQVSVELLSQTSQPREGAEERFRAALAAAYQKEHPEVKLDSAKLNEAAGVLARLYLNNVYPAMKLGWNVHRSNLGHNAEGVNNPGCFRCHDREREATLADGRKKKIGQQCDTCHAGLAIDEDPDKFDDTLAAMVPAAN